MIDPLTLVEIPLERRAPVIRAYLIRGGYPVFRIESAGVDVRMRL